MKNALVNHQETLQKETLADDYKEGRVRVKENCESEVTIGGGSLFLQLK